ncbi:MAG: hypothetical protein ACI9XO_003929 [Paraglaciecola sp.]
MDFYNLAAKVGKTADGERLTAHGMAQLLLSNGKKISPPFGRVYYFIIT